MAEIEFFDYSNMTVNDQQYIDTILFHNFTHTQITKESNLVYQSDLTNQKFSQSSYNNIPEFIPAYSGGQNSMYVNNDNFHMANIDNGVNTFIPTFNGPIVYYSTNNPINVINGQFVHVNYIPVVKSEVPHSYDNLNMNYNTTNMQSNINTQGLVHNDNEYKPITTCVSFVNNSYQQPNYESNNDSYIFYAEPYIHQTFENVNSITDTSPLIKSEFKLPLHQDENINNSFEEKIVNGDSASISKIINVAINQLKNIDNNKIQIEFQQNSESKLPSEDGITLSNSSHFNKCNLDFKTLDKSDNLKISNNNNKLTNSVTIESDSEKESLLPGKILIGQNNLSNESSNLQENSIIITEPKIKSWASVLMDTPGDCKNLATSTTTEQMTRKLSQSSNSNSVYRNGTWTKKKETDDKLRMKLADVLKSIKLVHKSVYLQPKGLNNRANWCYVNATMQALLMCPPLYNALISLPVFENEFYERRKLPLLKAILKFFHEFQPIDNRTAIKNTGKSNNVDIKCGNPFEPDYIYKVLQIIDFKAFKHNQQEDAEEFLSFLLNRLHDEIISATKNDSDIISSNNVVLNNGVLDKNSNDKMENGEEIEDSRWEQVRSKNKNAYSCQAGTESSFISDIFRGQICCVLQRSGQKESNMLQPFFTLQLDVQNDKITSVEDALEQLVLKESLFGYTCTKSNTEIDANQRIFLDQLPSVLVLHLKWFVYDSSGLQKCSKQFEFNLDLEISKEILSVHGKSKYSHVSQRKFKLFAVVNHIGARALGGHYTVDVFHSGYGCWLRCDDNKITMIATNNVIKMIPNRVPYLIFYRRTLDTDS